MKKAAIFLALFLSLATGAAAQGVRDNRQSNGEPQAQVKAAPAPQTFEAQYTGGLFGYSKKVKGALTYDDANQRLVFRNKQNKEVFGFPYKTLLVVQPTAQSYRPTGATVASNVPLPGAGLLGLIRSKNRFLTVQFNDQDSNVSGTASFKVANKELLASVIQSLGEKAGMKQRGDAYYRPREEAKTVLE